MGAKGGAGRQEGRRLSFLGSAHLASRHPTHAQEDFDATRWLDRSLIRLCARFGDYAKDDADSFQLRPQLAFFPQFMFHFRRSQFVQASRPKP